jgi:hypothetical protein
MEKLIYLIKIIYTTTIVLFLGIVAFAFYWYEWRPSKIRIECNDSAFIGSMKSLDESSYTQSGRMDLKEKFYKDCLRYKGLEK